LSFIDARNVESELIEADVCIVGAGAAGITIGHELGISRLKVALVESGGLSFSHAAQSLSIGDNVGLPSFSTATSRFRVFGGSTTRWGGQCRPLDPIDFELRPWMPHSGWPFSREYLEPYYARASVICHLRSGNFDPASCNQDPNNHFPFVGNPLETRIYQFSQLRDFGIGYAEEFTRSATANVYLNATILEIETDVSGNNVIALRAQTFGGKNLRFRASAYVLACGGIENARILLASNRIEAKGIGNRRGLVGRFFADHPYFLPGYLEPVDPRFNRSLYVIQDFERVGSEQCANAAFGLAEQKMREEQLNGASVYLVRRPDYKVQAEYFSTGGRSFNRLIDILRHRDLPDGGTLMHLRNTLGAFPDIASTIGRQVTQLIRPRPRLALRAVIETSPNPESRVTLGNAKDRFGMPRVQVDWRISRDDQRGLERLLSILRTELPRQGIGSLVEDFTRDAAGWPMSMVGGKHHIGTTRMHTDRKQGVVDPECRVHGLSNLFIAGSSVFPTPGYANPTLTIVALAVRLADRLKTLLALQNSLYCG
jgi:choline dehydrogenase-like flavoprotein